MFYKKSLNTPQGQSEAVNQRSTSNAMAKKKRKTKTNNDIPRTMHKTKGWTTWIPQKTGMNSGAPAYPTDFSPKSGPWSSVTQVLEYRINRERYTRYSYAAKMLPHINGKFTIGKLKSSVVVSSRSYRVPLSFLGFGKAMNPI